MTDQHEIHRQSKSRWALYGFLAVAGFFLYTEHRAHLFGVLPYLLLLACPLMHFFHGHGNHGGDEGHGDGDAHKQHEGHSSQGDKK